MNKKAIKTALKRLEDFESSSPYDTSEIEICMEALASELSRVLADDEDDFQELSLDSAIDQLPITNKAKVELSELCSKLEEAIERSDYDSEDDDQEEILSELKSDFYAILEKELTTLLKK